MTIINNRAFEASEGMTFVRKKNIFIYLGTGSNAVYNNNLDVNCYSNTFGSYMYYNEVKNGTDSISFELYTTGSTMRIRHLTINYIYDQTIPDGLITLNANYTQVLGLNEAGEVVCEPAFKQVATEADIDAMIGEVTT